LHKITIVLLSFVILVVVALSALLWPAECLSWWVTSRNRKGSAGRNTFQAPCALNEQPTAVSAVVSSLLLLGHEPSVPFCLSSSQGRPFCLQRSQQPVHQKADVHISTVVSCLFFVVSRFVTDWPLKREDDGQPTAYKKYEMTWLLLILLFWVVVMTVQDGRILQDWNVGHIVFYMIQGRDIGLCM
jgi:hypothetical protein